MALPLVSKPSLRILLPSGGVTSKMEFMAGSRVSAMALGTLVSSCSLTYCISTKYMCLPAVRLAASVAESRLLWCCDLETAPAVGSHMSVMSLANACALVSCDTPSTESCAALVMILRRSVWMVVSSKW